MADSSSPVSANQLVQSLSDRLSERKSRPKVTFPETESSVHTDMVPSAAEEAGIEQSKQNPFIMPPDDEIFLLRDKERQRKKEERIRQRKLHVHEKTTFSSRVNCRPAAMIHATRSEEELQKADKAAAVADDTQFTLAITRDRHVDKESLAEYIAKKREMFLVQYSLGVKRDEMRKLEEIAQAEERKLELAEQFLEEDAALFDDFLKENDKNSVEAIKVAEGEAKMKHEKINEIKQIQVAIMTVNSDISKYEETLREYKTYKAFLDSITPKEVLKGKQPQKQQQEVEEPVKVKKVTNTPVTSKRKMSSGRKASMTTRRMSSARKAEQQQPTQSGKISVIEDPVPESELEEDLELYFTDPHQVLDIFSELEEQNLSLIQNSQETEETLEEVKHNMRTTRKKMTIETKGLKEHIEKLQAAIGKETEKASQFQAKTKLFSHAAHRDAYSERAPVSLERTVEEVYRGCIGENDASMSTIEMLTALENLMEELFDVIETIPQEKVEAAEKTKEKERRLMMREEKLVEQRLYQEERVRRALERAKAEPKRMTGRRLVFRSQPPDLKKVRDDSEELARRREEEEFHYYFTW